jgi:hypothetical protein
MLYQIPTRRVSFLLSNCALQPWVPTVHRRLASSSNTLTMYFDDVSRHSTGWKPGKLLKNTDVSAFHRSEQKHDAVKRMLLGYDAESASVLSEDESTFLFSCALCFNDGVVHDACLTRVLQYCISCRTIDRRQSSNRCSSGRKHLA